MLPMRGTGVPWSVAYARKRHIGKGYADPATRETKSSGFIVLLIIVPRRYLHRLYVKSIIGHGKPTAYYVTSRFIVVVYVVLIIEKLWKQKNSQRYRNVDYVIKIHT